MDNGQQPMRVHLTRGALEAPDVILLVQSHQGLAVSQQAVAAGTPVFLRAWRNPGQQARPTILLLILVLFLVKLLDYS